MQYKAIFFDMDGTLTDLSTHQVPDSAIQALREAQARGVKIFLATGRPPQMLLPATEAIPFDGHLTANGQFCYNDKEVIYRNTIPQADKESLVELLKTHDIPLLFETESELYFTKIDERVQRAKELLDFPLFPVRAPVNCLTQNLFMFILFGDARAETLVTQAMPSCKSVRWINIFTDIIPANGGKEVGISAMLDYYGISREEAMAFGDAQNDVGMLTHVGLGVSMGSGTPEAKAAADYITDAPKADGIYNALKTFEVI